MRKRSWTLFRDDWRPERKVAFREACTVGVDGQHGSARAGFAIARIGLGVPERRRLPRHRGRGFRVLNGLGRSGAELSSVSEGTAKKKTSFGEVGWLRGLRAQTTDGWQTLPNLYDNQCYRWSTKVNAVNLLAAFAKRRLPTHHCKRFRFQRTKSIIVLQYTLFHCFTLYPLFRDVHSEDVTLSSEKLRSNLRAGNNLSSTQKEYE